MSIAASESISVECFFAPAMPSMTKCGYTLGQQWLSNYEGVIDFFLDVSSYNMVPDLRGG